MPAEAKSKEWALSANHLSNYVPENITLVLILLRSPELNLVENIWQFLRENWLSNRVFKNCDDIVALCCERWIKLMDQPRRITSIGRRKWAHEF